MILIVDHLTEDRVGKPRASGDDPHTMTAMTLTPA